MRMAFWAVMVAVAIVGSLLYKARRPRALLALAAVGLLGAIALTVSPSDNRGSVFCTVQFSVPFYGIETLANLAMLMPLTLFAALGLQRPLPVFAAVTGLSALIELVQAVVPDLGRSCDTNDWFMYTVGAAIGAIIATAIIALTARRARWRRTSE